VLRDALATVLYREINPMQIIQKFIEWHQNYKENKITAIYDTMWNSTRSMSEEIVISKKTA
jgi:flavorubredoxin